MLSVYTRLRKSVAIFRHVWKPNANGGAANRQRAVAPGGAAGKILQPKSAELQKLQSRVHTGFLRTSQTTDLGLSSKVANVVKESERKEALAYAPFH